MQAAIAYIAEMGILALCRSGTADRSRRRLYAEAATVGHHPRIAGEAGVNEITLFRHFGSKDALIREAISRADTLLAPDVALPESPPIPSASEEIGPVLTLPICGRRSLIRTRMGEVEEHPGIFSAENSRRPRPPRRSPLSPAAPREWVAKAPFDEAAAPLC